MQPPSQAGGALASQGAMHNRYALANTVQAEQNKTQQSSSQPSDGEGPPAAASSLVTTAHNASAFAAIGGGTRPPCGTVQVSSAQALWWVVGAEEASILSDRPHSTIAVYAAMAARAGPTKELASLWAPLQPDQPIVACNHSNVSGVPRGLEVWAWVVVAGSGYQQQPPLPISGREAVCQAVNTEGQKQDADMTLFYKWLVP